MALGMKHWLGLVAIGFALVALNTLPPKTLDVPTRRDAPLQEERYLEALRADIVNANNQLQRMRWAETVIPATLSAQDELLMSFPDNTAPNQLEKVRTRTLTELAEFPGGAGNVALGVFFLDYRQNRYDGAPTGYQIDALYYFGVRDGRPYCAAVHPVWRQDREGSVSLPSAGRDESYLGLCGLVRQFGLPGPAVQQWLAEGGTALAASALPGQGTVLFYRDLRDASFARRGFLGRKDIRFSWLMTRVDYDRCFAGVPEGCARMFLAPKLDSWRGPGFLPEGRMRPFTPAQAVQAGSIFEPADYHVAADLAQEFGRERFMRWWTADGEVADAFQAAFGVDVGTWNLGRISRFVTIAKPGPAVSEAGVLGGVLLLAFASLVAGLWARRRTVA